MSQTGNHWRLLFFFKPINSKQVWKGKTTHACPRHTAKHLPVFSALSVCCTQTSGEYDEAEHWQKACSDNISPFSKKMDLAGILNTWENKNILLTPGGTTILSISVGRAKIERHLWHFLELWCCSHTRILYPLARNRNLHRQQHRQQMWPWWHCRAQRLKPVGIPTSRIAVLHAQRACTTCWGNGEWTSPSNKIISDTDWCEKMIDTKLMV